MNNKIESRLFAAIWETTEKKLGASIAPDHRRQLLKALFYSGGEAVLLMINAMIEKLEAQHKGHGFSIEQQADTFELFLSTIQDEIESYLKTLESQPSNN